MPALDPWMIRTERATPPTIYVRNPYYWAVDEEGRQLPYLDRIVVNDKSLDMLTIAAAQGEVSMQARYVRNEDYILLMNQRRQFGYQVHHFINGDGADWALSFNLMRRREEGNVAIDQKADLLADKRFRQALALAIDRQAIVDALFPGMTRPHQTGPVSPSPHAVEAGQDPYARFDPAQANALLDACGLTSRDADGYRCLPNGPVLVFDINYGSFMSEGPGEFIVDDWRNVGVRARLRPQDRTIFYVEKSAGLHDISVWSGYGAFLPLLDPRYYFPFSRESNFAVRQGNWYRAGGLFAAPDDATIRGDAPPIDSLLRRGMELYEEVKQAGSPERRQELFGEMLTLAMENVYVLNLLQDLQQELGLTYIFIAHDLSVVKHLCDRIAVMYAGRIVELAKTADLFKDPQHPYTRALLSAVSNPDPDQPMNLDLRGEVADPGNLPSGCAFHPRCPERFAPCDKECPALVNLPGGRSTACHLAGRNPQPVDGAKDDAPAGLRM